MGHIPLPHQSEQPHQADPGFEEAPKSGIVSTDQLAGGQPRFQTQEGKKMTRTSSARRDRGNGDLETTFVRGAIALVAVGMILGALLAV